jgi:predicted small lipoprotein YifL
MAMSRFIVLLLLMLLSACGQKGPLYLPVPAASVQPLGDAAAQPDKRDAKKEPQQSVTPAPSQTKQQP